MVRAAVLREIGTPLRVEDIDLPWTGPGQVRVRLRAAGVCHSDLSFARGTLRQPVPAVLGHEGAGVVVDVGEGVGSVSRGDHVLLIWSPPCRECWHCRAASSGCASGLASAARPYAKTFDGRELYPEMGVAAFAEETWSPSGPWSSCPTTCRWTPGAAGCAVITGVGAVLHSAKVQPGETVAVFGLGGVGLSAVQGARIAGASQIITVDPVSTKEARRGCSGRPRCDDRGGRGDPDARAHRRPRRRPRDRVRRAQRRDPDRVVEHPPRRQDDRRRHGVPRGHGRLQRARAGHFGRSLEGCLYGSADPAVDIPVLIDHVNAGRIDLEPLVSTGSASTTSRTPSTAWAWGTAPAASSPSAERAGARCSSPRSCSCSGSTRCAARWSTAARPELMAGLAGAIEAELALGGAVALVDKRVTAAGGPRPEDPLLAAAYDQLVGPRGRRAASQLRLLDQSLDVWAHLVDGLAYRDVLTRRVDRILGFSITRHPVLDRALQDDVVSRVRQAVAGDDPFDPRTAVLVALSGPCRLLKVVAPDRAGRRHAKSRIKLAQAQVPIAPAVISNIRALHASSGAG